MKITVPVEILEQVPDDRKDLFLKYIDTWNEEVRLLEEKKVLQAQKEEIHRGPVVLRDTIDYQWQAPYKNKELLYQKYIEEQLSALEIANRFCCSKSTILKHLKKFDIEIRDTGKSINKKKGLAYGKRIEKRQQMAHKREQANIQKMRELRGKGYSFHKIAEILNTMKVPTKTRKGKWHGRVIWEILKRHESE